MKSQLEIGRAFTLDKLSPGMDHAFYHAVRPAPSISVFSLFGQLFFICGHFPLYICDNGILLLLFFIKTVISLFQECSSCLKFSDECFFFG